jgi:hypothetical protein
MSDNEQRTQMQALAVVETITSLEELRQLLGQRREAATFQFEHCTQSPQGYHWFSVCADTTDALDAMTTVRNVLDALLALADQGRVLHFRIVTGADLLRHAPGELGGGPCVA